MVEKENGATVEDKRFLWYGMGVAEERDSAGTATKRYFGGGVQQGGSSYLFAPDHLGTVREMSDTSGAARARYDLDPYGRRTKTAGDLDTDLGFASTTAHGATGLSLAVFRAYDPDRARWLNEDPVGLAGGLNLYAYVDGDPINQVDPLGLWSQWHQMAAPLIPGLWLWHPTALQSTPMGWLTWTSNFWGGFGHNLTLGGTSWINDKLGNPLNRCSPGFKGGEWAGVAWQIAFGAATGWATSTVKGPGLEFSHWVPTRLLKNLSSFWRNQVGRSRLNGNFVPPWRHFKHDPFRFPPGWQQMGNRFPAAIQQLDRIPWVFKLGGAGGAWGGFSMWLGSSGCP